MSRQLRYAVLLTLLIGCRDARKPDVVIVTFDTARADAFGAYGSRSGATPATDAISRAGVVFESATAPVPLTLPSHTSLLTGMYPPHHGIRENGTAMVPDALMTLAELFRDNGWATGAFVGAYVLDARWGLDQGFDVYQGRFDRGSEEVFSLGDLERRANEVIDDALRWIESRDPSKPMFVWVHLFDPHTPYEPPPPFDSRFAGDPYIGEIAFADSQVARLLRSLDRDRSIVLIAGDHGEAFGEHDERGHGLLLYEEVLRVPLVLAAPNLPAGKRVTEPVSLVDVFPTLAELAGVKAPAVHGNSLVPLVRGGGKHPTAVYSETLYPLRRFGWSDMKMLRDGPSKLIDSSRPELYDVAADPGENRDLASSDPQRVRELRGRLRKLISAFERDAPAATAAQVDDGARARLFALGYISGPVDSPAAGPLPHPRDKIAVFDRVNEARSKIISGEHEEAERLLASVVSEEPRMLEAHVARGELRLRGQRWREAADAFRSAYAIAPEDPAVIAALATADLHAGRASEALELLAVAIEREPREPRFRYVAGRAHLVRGELDAARRQFENAIALNPGSAAALVELAGIAVARGEPATARELAMRALAIDRGVRGARLHLAHALERLGRVDEAWEAANSELRDAPHEYRAAWYLAGLSERMGRTAEIENYLVRVIEAQPCYLPAYLRLARLYLDRGERSEEGVQLASRALELGPKEPERALAHFLLADFYNRLGRHELSRQHAEAARRVQEKM